jgi:tRNA A-37 threonylcarbamoyl transferase component Bud32
MGEVWLATTRGPEGFRKLVVVKRIAAHLASDPEFVEMFLSEARLAAQLGHSNLVQIFDLGDIDGRLGIVMEYVPGKSLRAILEREGRRLHPMHAAEIVSRLCAGLAYAHTAKDLRGKPLEMVHRDVNPNNVLVTWSGEVKLIDFGIAKSRLSSVHTAEGVIKGKFAYLSPEQSRSEIIDHRSDLFAAGICLYQTLSGKNPFDGEDPGAVVDAIEHYQPPALETVAPELAPFDAVVRRALAKRPADRYQSADELRADLELLMHSGALSPPPMSLGEWLSRLFQLDRQTEEAKVARLTGREDSQPTRKLDEGELRPRSLLDRRGRRRSMLLAVGGAAVVALAAALAFALPGWIESDEEHPVLVEPPPRPAPAPARPELGRIQLDLDPDLTVAVDGATSEAAFDVRREHGTIVITGPKAGAPVRVVIAYRVVPNKPAAWAIDVRPRLPVRIDGAPRARLPTSARGDVTIELTLPSRRHLKVGLRHEP